MSADLPTLPAAHTVVSPPNGEPYSLFTARQMIEYRLAGMPSAPGAPQEAAAVPDPWHTAVLAECMLTEACYQEADPAGTVKRLIDWHVANAARPAAPVIAYATVNEEGDPAMLFFDKQEAVGYCEDGEEPIPLADARGAPAVGQEADAFPFYELRFIMRVLSHKGRASEEDWKTAHGMAIEIFQKWHAAALAGGDGGEGS